MERLQERLVNIEGLLTHGGYRAISRVSDSWMRSKFYRALETRVRPLASAKLRGADIWGKNVRQLAGVSRTLARISRRILWVVAPGGIALAAFGGLKLREFSGNLDSFAVLAGLVIDLSVSLIIGKLAHMSLLQLFGKTQIKERADLISELENLDRQTYGSVLPGLLQAKINRETLNLYHDQIAQNSNVVAVDLGAVKPR